MINQTQLRYGRQKMKERFEKNQEDERRRRQTNDRIYKSFNKDIPQTIPNMTDALKEVREKNYITHEESYARLTGGYRPMKDLKTK